VSKAWGQRTIAIDSTELLAQGSGSSPCGRRSSRRLASRDPSVGTTTRPFSRSNGSYYLSAIRTCWQHTTPPGRRPGPQGLLTGNLPPSLIGSIAAAQRRFRTFAAPPQEGGCSILNRSSCPSQRILGLPGRGHSHNANQQLTPTDRAAPSPPSGRQRRSLR
jgi:hypothetical protein